MTVYQLNRDELELLKVGSLRSGLDTSHVLLEFGRLESFLDCGVLKIWEFIDGDLASKGLG